MTKYLFWSLFAVTLAVYAAIIGWSLPAVSSAAGGLAPFDMRPGGYSQADALQFVAALSAEGRDFYLNVQQRLDLFYPALASLTLFFALSALLPRQLGKWRYAAAAVALPIAAFDYLENHAVAMMLQDDPAKLAANLVAEASRWTVLKSGLSTAVMSAIVVLLAWHAGRAVYRRLRPAVSPAIGP